MNYNTYKVLIEDKVLGDFNRLALLHKNATGKKEMTSALYFAILEAKLEILSKSPKAREQLRMNLIRRRY